MIFFVLVQYYKLGNKYSTSMKMSIILKTKVVTEKKPNCVMSVTNFNTTWQILIHFGPIFVMRF